METHFTEQERQQLLTLARESIRYGLLKNNLLSIDVNAYSENLRQSLACFVTLTMDGALRGCMGSLLAHQPLVVDVVHNANAAAFSDPRFMPLGENEFSALEIHISILSRPEPIRFTSEADLIQQVRPGIDGLILTENGFKGTFLPSVWEELSTPEEFIAHLKLKAGLPMDYWSDTIAIERYTTQVIE